MNRHYPAVAERARHRCEYCHAPEAAFNFRFEVEHVASRAAGGSGHLSNLALACRSCNLHKADAATAVHPESGDVAPLFDPRTDTWDAVFVVGRNEVIRELTATARATAAQLHMNSDEQVAARRLWRILRLFP